MTDRNVLIRQLTQVFRTDGMSLEEARADAETFVGAAVKLGRLRKAPASPEVVAARKVARDLLSGTRSERLSADEEHVSATPKSGHRCAAPELRESFGGEGTHHSRCVIEGDLLRVRDVDGATKLLLDLREVSLVRRLADGYSDGTATVSIVLRTGEREEVDLPSAADYERVVSHVVALRRGGA